MWSSRSRKVQELKSCVCGLSRKPLFVRELLRNTNLSPVACHLSTWRLEQTKLIFWDCRARVKFAVRVSLLGGLQISSNFTWWYPLLSTLKPAYSRSQETIRNLFMVFLNKWLYMHFPSISMGKQPSLLIQWWLWWFWKWKLDSFKEVWTRICCIRARNAHSTIVLAIGR